jgi:hypothetical protein
MAGGYLGNVYNEYATGNNLMRMGTNLVSNGTFKKEEFMDNTDLANIFGMLGILIIIAIILVLGYKFMPRKHK